MHVRVSKPHPVQSDLRRSEQTSDTEAVGGGGGWGRECTPRAHVQISWWRQQQSKRKPEQVGYYRVDGESAQPF